MKTTDYTVGTKVRIVHDSRQDIQNKEAIIENINNVTLGVSILNSKRKNLVYLDPNAVEIVSSGESVNTNPKKKVRKDLKRNNSGSASKLKFPKKEIIYATSGITLLFLLTTWIFSDNEFTQKIKETCIDCSEIEITDSDLILTTNGEGKSNIFSKTSMSFLLTEWYEVVYDEGIFYDDITFDVNGKKISVTESDYNLLNDFYLISKSQPKDYEQWKKIIDINHKLICDCYDSAKSSSGDIYGAIEKCDKKFFLGFNFRDKLSASESKKAINYEDNLFDERQLKIKKYIPKVKEKIYTCSICGREIGPKSTSMFEGKCYQCYQYTSKSKSNVDLTRF